MTKLIEDSQLIKAIIGMAENLERPKTLRDEFAMAALAGYIAFDHCNPVWAAYRTADEMMEARKK